METTIVVICFLDAWRDSQNSMLFVFGCELPVGVMVAVNKPPVTKDKKAQKEEF
jgi:hypothetical protein